ncbi:MAG: hypothetical protein GC201_12085 [Alphaproteobacteria bacterium]|nr:hypothetical protein [Alphaproteobacteria bacterium]
MNRASNVMASAICAAVTLAIGATAAYANGFLENRPWQFDTANDKIAKASMTDLIEKKKGGYYDGFQTNINNTYSTNIAGDQINCNLTASAIGNTGANSVSSHASSPSVDLPGSIGADATGNVSTTSANGKDPYTSTGGSQSGSGGQSSAVGQAGQLTNTSQGNTDSPQQASVDNSSISSSADNMNTSGGTSDVALNSDMSNSDSPQSASVDNSEACGFSKSAAAPLN